MGGFSCTPGTGKGVVGTPPYIAPESYSRGEYTIKSDVYALGVIFYEMVTGVKYTLRTTINTEIFVERGLSPKLADIIMRMLDPEPNMRPSTRKVLVALKTVERV